MVIFGATGDLTQRKLIPALYHLFQRNKLPEHFYIVGFSRREYDLLDFKSFLTDAIKKYRIHHFDQASWEIFLGKCYYQQGDFGEEKAYRQLIEKLKEFDDLRAACVPRFFYLATPPNQYEKILNNLDHTKLSEGCGQGSDKWTKVMVEKPFGRDLADSQKLDLLLSKIFKEDQIYRIDHYLGKETIQNILAFRFGNTIFDPVWNNKYIDCIQITIAETLGVETRGNFYEGIGALRDMAQSHLLEQMAAIAMEQPQSFDASGIRKARTKSIKDIVCLKPLEIATSTVRGQYGPSDKSKVKSEKSEIGYRQEANVSPISNTETFVALKLFIDNPRWKGVPFYLRTGKRLSVKTNQISVVFKEPLLKMFGKNKAQVVPNVLTFQVEPNQGIVLTLNAKKIGFLNEFNPVPMSFIYDKAVALTDAYEKILLDAMMGDQTLFTATDEVKASWQLISAIAQGWWKSGSPTFPNYANGTWGPQEATELIEKDGRKWL
jgi:glucose-6-phosphate 1-dehydrogenase